jgi:putative oxidoreductase
VHTLFWSRVSGPPAVAVAAVRIATGVVFLLIGAGKFADHASEAADFDRYGIPLPGAAAYGVGTVEVVAGALLVAGFLTRPAAGALAFVLVGAIVTAGRVEGGTFNLGVAPALLVVVSFLLVVGSGRYAFDATVDRKVAGSPQGRP